MPSLPNAQIPRASRTTLGDDGSRSVEVVLTGDRPTGPLHLGHLAGSLRKRVALQDEHFSLMRGGSRGTA